MDLDHANKVLNKFGLFLRETHEGVTIVDDFPRADYTELVQSLIENRAETVDCQAFLPKKDFYVVEDAEGYHIYDLTGAQTQGE